MKKSLYLLLLLFLSACSFINSNNEQKRWEKHVTNTLIIRDDYGVPHIYGKTDADAVFGMLYAQCEDDFRRVEYNYILFTGRLGEVEGEEALFHDLRANLFMTKEEAVRHYDNCPEWLKELCIAFADGVNYYLHTHPEIKPLLFTRFEPWMPMYFTEGSISSNIEQIDIQKIKAFYSERTVLSEDMNTPEYENTFFGEEPSGSNGIAISGELTESGNTLLLINPHTSFYFRGEMHVVSEKGLNAYGAVTWGQFFIYQGFNEKIGWMHTSGYADVMDEFMETIEEDNGSLRYKYGDEFREVEIQEVTLKYKSSNEMKEKTFPVYRTHHGPVTHKMEDKWIATSLMWEPVKALSQSYLRTKVNSQSEVRELMNMRTNSSNNTVYADADGNIGYYHGNFIPIRDVRFDYSRPVDGSNPATDWQGLHSVDEIITVFNPPNGWIQNCNSTPFTCCGEYSPVKENYPYYMTTEPENFRGINAIRLLKDRKDFTMDGLIELAYNPYLTGFEELIPGLIEAYDKTAKKDPLLEGPINVLKKWDLKTSVGSTAMSLAHFYGSLYIEKGSGPAGLSPMERINYFGTGSSFEERLAVFKEAVHKITLDFGKWDVPWGEIHRYQRLTGDIHPVFDDNAPSIPVGLASGIWGSLAAYGMRVDSNTRRIYGTRGNSFVAVVEFGERVKAKSILIGGQSGNPISPHFTDQVEGYLNGNFKEVAYYREDVEKRAKKTYWPGQIQ